MGPPLHLRQLHAEVRDAPAAAARGQLHGRRQRLHPDGPARVHDPVRPGPSRPADPLQLVAVDLEPGALHRDRRGRRQPARHVRGRCSRSRPKFVEKKIIPCAQPWLGAGGTFAQLYWTHIYNSTGHSDVQRRPDPGHVRWPGGPVRLPDDRGRTQERLVGRPLPEHHQRARGVRRVRQGQHGDGHAQRVRDPTDREGAGRRRQARTSASSRASSPARQARPRAPTALGVNKWTKQPEASWSYFNRLFTPDIALADQPARAGALPADAQLGARRPRRSSPPSRSSRRTRRRPRA